MPKVMFILHTYSVGGAERRCVAIANYLASLGVKVQIVLLDVNKMYDCKRDNNGLEIDIRLVDSPKFQIPTSKDVEVVYLLHENEPPCPDKHIISIPYCESDKPQISPSKLIVESTEQANKAKIQLASLEAIYINRIFHYVKINPDYMVISWMSFCNISTAVALRELKNKFAFVECTSPDTEFPIDGANNYLKHVFYRRASAGFFQTKEIMDFYNFLTDTKKFVIPNPILKVLPQRCSGSRKKVVVNFCRIEKPKNLDLLIEVFQMFLINHPEYSLLIIGEGSEKKHLQEMVKAIGIDANVVFKDYQNDVHKSILDCAMYVSTSSREGISNSMIEAMAIGLPTICTDCHGGGARSTIKNGKNGLLVPMNDKIAILNAMKLIAENQDFSEKISKNAAKVRNELTIEKIGSMWFRAINSI